MQIMVFKGRMAAGSVHTLEEGWLAVGAHAIMLMYNYRQEEERRFITCDCYQICKQNYSAY